MIILHPEGRKTKQNTTNQFINKSFCYNMAIKKTIYVAET